MIAVLRPGRTTRSIARREAAREAAEAAVALALRVKEAAELVRELDALAEDIERSSG